MIIDKLYVVIIYFFSFGRLSKCDPKQNLSLIYFPDMCIKVETGQGTRRHVPLQPEFCRQQL